MQNITLRDFLNYRYVVGLKLAPDQKKLSFFTAMPNEEKNAYDSALWVCNCDGSDCREITSVGADRISEWENAETLLFSGIHDEALKERVKAGEEWTVFYRQSLVSTAEATEAFRVPYRVNKLYKINDRYYAAIVRYTYGLSGLGELTHTEREKRLAQIEEEKDYDVFDEIPFWFNGKGIINGVRERLYLLDSTNGSMKAVSEDYATVEQVCVQNGELLFTANTYCDKKESTNALWRYTLGDIKPKLLIAQGTLDVQYAANLDGKTIIFGSDMKRFGVNENPGIFELTQDGLRLQMYYDLSAKSSVGSDCRMGDGACYSVSGKYLYFLSTVENHTAICRYSVAGGVERLFEKMGSVDELAIGDSELYFTGLQNDGLAEVYRCEAGEAIAVSNVNALVMAQRNLAKTEWITFTYKGVTFQGGVILPINYDPSKRYPGILTIHGGPKAVYGEVFYHEFQFWAAQGYFVFFTNPIGSDGRGNEFADIVGKQGTVDYEELMSFTDAVLEHYPALDSKRLGVTGSSYGGFMTNWIIGHTDRFACAVAQCSIANWISKVMTTDIGYFFNTTQLGATPWSDPEKMWFHSPMKYANKVKTPTLFVHGQEDHRCWLAEPLQMFMSLKYHGVPSKVLVVHGEHHGMARGKPRHRIHRLTEIINWFDRYLK